MPRRFNRLSARGVTTASTPGRHADGGGLYLIVDASGAKRWLCLFRWQGKLKEMGLGGIDTVSLAEARERASEARALVASGTNPIEARRALRQAAIGRPRFGEFADALVAEISEGFRNDKHRAQWRMTLTTYAAPLRDKPIDEINSDDVLGVLRPIWQTKPETASRLRGRIERVLDAARARGLRTGDNPARWRGHLKLLLPPASKLARGHHGAMPYMEVPAFMAQVRASPAEGARALEFCILTAARSSETLHASWSEIDLSSKVWTVPPQRMKAGREHRAPLSAAAVAVLQPLLAARRTDYVFAGRNPDRPLSGMAMAMVLRRMGRDDVTVHGFRSSFRDWCAEETDVPREIAEAALAHVVGNATERAYRRGDALEKRRELMERWGGRSSRRAAEDRKRKNKLTNQ